jgi:hypothetical protein
VLAPVVSLLVAVLGAGAPAAAASPSPADVSFELTRLNRTYSDIAGEMAPLDLDPVTVRLSSTHQTIVVRRNRITLRPIGDGSFEGSAEIELFGKGDLAADVAFGSGTPQHLTDELVLPQQRIVLDGRVRIARAQGGYEVTTEQLPPELRVDIRSRMVGDFLQACAGMALLSLGAVDCDRAAQTLERPALPMPPPGSRFLLADADLTAADRARLDALLAAD